MKITKNSFWFCFFICVFSYLSPIPSTFSETLPSLKTPFIGLVSGLEGKEVVQIFGEPDQVSKGSQSGFENWHYGQSVIFFRDHQVMAWSDRGELSEKMELGKYKRENNQNSSKWLNPWTYQGTPQVNEVIEEIFENN